MLEKIPMPAPHVLAVRASGKIDGADVDAFANTLEALLEEEDRVSFYIEIADFQGMTADAVARDLLAGVEMLGELSRFMRCAVVTDVPWIAAAARIESRLLPHIDLRVFDPSERDEALEWVAIPVEPRRLPKKPAGPGAKLIETTDPAVVAFETIGRFTEEDVKRLAPIIHARCEDHGKIRLLNRMTGWDGFDLSLLFSRETYAMKMEALDHVEKYAIVGGPDRRPPAGAVRPSRRRARRRRSGGRPRRAPPPDARAARRPRRRGR